MGGLDFGCAPPPSGPVRPLEARGGLERAGLAGLDRWIEEVEGPRPGEGSRPAQSAVFRGRSAKGVKRTRTGDPEVNGCTTLFEMFEKSVKDFPDRPALGVRPVDGAGNAGPYQWMSYKRLGEYVRQASAGLSALGLGSGDRAGVYGPNCPEWMIAMQSTNRMGMQCVPLYDTLGANAVEFILNHSESSVAFASADKMPKLAEALPKCKGVKTVVYWGDVTEEALAAVRAVDGLRVMSFEELLESGAKSPDVSHPPQASDICTIMYTSGTTGDPKGVLLKHSAVVNTLAGLLEYLNNVGLVLGEEDLYLSYLPLAHIFDRVCEEAMIAVAAPIAYWQGDVKKILDDVDAAKPTLFCGVPRIFDRVYAGVKAKMSASPVKNFLFNWGYGQKLGRLERGVPQADAAWMFDKILFKKVAAKLGGRVKVVISGAAPLAKHVEEFLRVCLCAGVVQGYGLTESCAASFVGVPDLWEFQGTVGVPFPNVEFRLEAVPDMEYYPSSDPPRGEVILKSPSLFSGYHMRDDLTKGAIDADGWFHTGDVGEMQPNGSLKIVDRKKNIFKLSQGEYVAVEHVESVLKKNTLFDMLWVYGNSFENFLVAVAVPNEAQVMAFAKENDIQGDYAAVCTNEKTKKFVLEELTKTGRVGKLKGFEVAKAVHLTHEPFSVEDDLLTPTFKMKRPQMLKFFKTQVDAMYAAAK